MFWSDKKYGYFKASLASLAVSIGIQLVLVFAQNRMFSLTRMIRESLPVLIGFKPAVDAYRVTTGKKRQIGEVFDPMTEMTSMKVVEIFSEAIPGVIIQLMAILTATGDDKTVATEAWISLAVSALSTGFAGATISYDWDTDPGKRERVPQFYGYVPSNAAKRSMAFVAMVLFSAGMLLTRCYSIVLMGLLGSKFAFAFVGADLGLYLLVKVLRKDFWYWLPLGNNKLELFSSLIARIMVKIITDFTATPQFRHPNEVGGLYWLFGLILTMGGLPATLTIYKMGGGKVRTIEGAKMAMFVLLPATLCSLSVFMLNIDSKFRSTFWSPKTGKDLTTDKFHSSTNDKIKAETVFLTSRNQWRNIEGEVKAWVEVSWSDWEVEKPEWLDKVKDKIPLEFIPTPQARKRESMHRATVKKMKAGELRRQTEQRKKTKTKTTIPVVRNFGKR
jgi:hypothetical protein